MKKLIFNKYILAVVIGVLAFTQGKTYAEVNDNDTIPFLYGISVKQSFSSWGDCSSDPDFDYADISIYFNDEFEEEQRIVNRNIYYHFDYEFINDSLNKDISYLYYNDGNDNKYSYINFKVHTNASDIINDKDLYYTIVKDSLKIGLYSEPHEASDPCNNFISNNREGYKMTTKVYVDDPIFISIVGTETYRYNLDYQKVAIRTDNYYQNDLGGVLQVRRKNTKGWKTIKNINAPNKTIYLSYEDIAGKKGADGSYFYKWMGKPLEFRVVKNLLNGNKSAGNFTKEVTFYPSGLQYTIEQTKRTSCNNKVILHVSLVNTDDQGYFELDPNLFYWIVSSEDDAYWCIMNQISSLKYEITIDQDKTPGDPFGEYSENDVAWTLQLIDMNNPDSYACEKTFTVPKTPENISVTQKLPTYKINGDLYDIPTANNPYVLLDITDPYELAALRRPYIITDGDSLNVKIDTIAPRYEDLSQEQKNEYDTIFKYHFLDLTSLYEKDNPYKNYFIAKYLEWFDTLDFSSPYYRIESPYEDSAFSIYSYHEHYHEHRCSHSHLHYHCCTEDVTIPAIKCDDDFHYVEDADPHYLCDDNHTHQETPHCGDLEPSYDYHEHFTNHSHIHSHPDYTGLHNHTHSDIDRFNYKVVKKLPTIGIHPKPIPIITPSYYSNPYNYVESVTLITEGLNAKYIFRRNGEDIDIPIWTENDIVDNLYPDKGMALNWYDEFRAIYKEQWLGKELGTKVPILRSMVNEIPESKERDLILYDKDGCPYSFTINVDAPEDPDFSQDVDTVPETICARNGRVKVTYNGGGYPPYYHTNGVLREIGDTIIVDELGYGTEQIKFTYGTAVPYYFDVRIGDETDDISVTPYHQTCDEPNGKIIIDAGNIPEPRTYYLISGEDNDTIEQNIAEFINLSTGSYSVIVKNGPCEFDKTGIKINDSIFQISQIDTTNATSFGGKGGVSISFDNKTNDITWGSDLYPIFSSPETSNPAIYSNIRPDIYNYEATHIDNDNRECSISGQFEIQQPEFTVEVNIDETNNEAKIQAKVTYINDLVRNIHFQLVPPVGDEIVGENNKSFSTTVESAGQYTLKMYYNGNQIDIHKFDIKQFQINSGFAVTDTIGCPGGDAKIELNPSGGFEDAEYLTSTDGFKFEKKLIDTVKAGLYNYYIRCEKIPDTEYYITVHHILTNEFNDTIAEPIPVYADILTTDISCKSLNDGTVSLINLSNGSGTYEYHVDNFSWKDPLTETLNLSPGEHTVYLKDSGNGCDQVNLGSFNINEPDTLTIDSLRIAHPTCELDNGKIYIEANGGNGLYRFDWNYNGNLYYTTDSALEDSITYIDTLAYGNYNIVVTDNMNCVYNQIVELNEYFNPEIIDFETTDVRCYGENNGEIKVNTVSGTTGLNKVQVNGVSLVYTDEISNIANSFTGLPNGTYQLIAIDDSTCSSDPYPLTIYQPDTIVYSLIDTIVPVINKGNNTGRIYTTVYGGNDGLKTISLLNSENAVIDQNFEPNHFQTYFDSLYAGTYSIQVTDRKGCTFNSPAQIVIEPEIALGFNIIEKLDAQCKAQTGSFTIEGIGGWGEYSYKRAIDNGYYNFNTFNNLYAGNYIVSVKDKLGAIFTDTLKIYEPEDSLKASLIDFTDPTCSNNGSISINLNGGVAPYKLFFENSSDTTEIANPQEYTISNRPAGGYLLHVEDDHGCKYELETNLSDENQIEIIAFNKTYPSNNGESDGALEVIVKGGKAPLNYAWRELYGASLAETGSLLSNVPSGYYEATVSEQDGCSETKYVYLPNISDQALEIVDLQQETSYLAKNGFAQLFSNLDSLVNIEIVNPEGVKTIYNITDSTADYYEKDANLYIKNLSGGNYYVLATNISGYKAYAEFNIEPYSHFFFESIQVSHAKEMNDTSGIINVIVGGGAGENTFVWEYLDGVLSKLDSISSEYTSILKNVLAGNYRITVTDKYGNIITQDILIKQPDAPLEISISEYQNESCKNYEDAYVILEATGGWGDYQFKQDSVQYFSNSNTWSNLKVREHYFYLTDKMGVVDSVAINITEPDYLNSNITFIDSVDCKSANDGVIFFDIVGGTKPYRFAFLDDPALWTQDTIANNLEEGTYSFIFTDANNCIGQDTILTYMPEPDSLLFSNIDITHTTCNTDNGTITVSLQGGSLPYRYEWTDLGGNVLGTEKSISGLKQNGRYIINVLDAHDCMQQYEQLINPSTNPIVVDIDTTPVLCYSGNTGTASVVEVTPAVPFAPYTLSWSNSDIGEYSEGYQAGIHWVSITDTNNCSTIKYFEVTQPDTLHMDVSDFKDAHCFGYNDGYIQILASGGVGNYKYEWSNGEITERIENLYKGIYTVTITDTNLCSIQETFEITEPDKLIVDLGDNLKICPGNTITVDGQEFATHQWTKEEKVISNERFLSIDDEGTYYLEVTDEIGCFAYDDISITIGNDALEADFLLSSLSDLGDTIFLYEISNLELDSSYWDYDNEIFSNVTSEELPEYMLQLQSNEIGIYNISLWAYSGGCMSAVTKQIEIVTENDTVENDNSLGYIDPLIQKLSIYPNPTDGNFILEVDLREASDIDVDIFSINYGVIIDNRKEYGLDYYEVDYQLNNINTGMYIIIVTAKNERKQIKIIVE